ncbi:MAG: enoyl-CoA hydratase-related protein [Paracoccaceae bacterium]
MALAYLRWARTFGCTGRDARWRIIECARAWIPDMGITQSLPKLMRADQAKRLMMTAEMVTGERAAALGLVTELAEDPMADARALAAGIAARSPDAVAGIKRLVGQELMDLPQARLAVEAALQAPIIGAPNQVEAVAANMQKRPPRFR